MTYMRRYAILAGVLSVLAVMAAPLHAQDQLPTIDPAARPIVEQVNRFYRGLSTVTCTAEVEVQLGDGAVDDRVAMYASAVRPNLVSVIAVEPHGYFPTNQFVSNGKDLFEWSIRRRMFMISDPAVDFQGLFNRAATRSAPNMPIEVVLAMMSEEPMQNLLRLDVEPGMIRLVGESEVEGVRCHELVVNEGGSRAWIRIDAPPWLMRYRNSPRIALPRYLPEGTKVTGPHIQIDFKSWSMTPPKNDTWEWIVPEGTVRMATMHESAKGGPEDGYTSLTLVPGESGAPTNLQVKPGVRLSDPLPEGPPIGSLAPEIELIRVDGTRKSLSSVRGERPAVLVFWIGKNKVSRTSIPRLLEALKPLTGRIAIIPIGSGETEAEVRAVVKRNNAFAGSFADAGSVAADQFDVAKVTAVILLNREGKVDSTFVGPTPGLSTRVVSACKRLLEKPAVDKEPANASEESDDKGDSPKP